ncbi:uncharacterized protein MYCFIDRAFT_173840 [Pseudocercospora fijiensis CIRAD86]|uniref:Uncharacterized protein n=1 Tax=Pseudocercospora fijiensis (strain CIRAD86) TaxID=383855 RepID=M3AK50_PSEFD|nr:uncharacterized protein MYCFIDRAFT_173840 [Pseudocercospora fijiensis CIRAD86]EME84956.1 hypothetical protein MYCFIDRAFT_173840 [Pseudocercospora fijiensis CIRAD86]
MNGSLCKIDPPPQSPAYAIICKKVQPTTNIQKNDERTTRVLTPWIGLPHFETTLMSSSRSSQRVPSKDPQVASNLFPPVLVGHINSPPQPSTFKEGVSRARHLSANIGHPLTSNLDQQDAARDKAPMYLKQEENAVAQESSAHQVLRDALPKMHALLDLFAQAYEEHNLAKAEDLRKRLNWAIDQNGK